MAMKLLDPEYLWSRPEVLAKPSPVPHEPGIYAWYFKEIPDLVPINGCRQHNGCTLLYIGISPKRPPAHGASLSKQNLFERIRFHYRGHAEGSTLRLTLGCLLAKELGIQLRRTGSGKSMTFSEGEADLSKWMEDNAFVTWVVDPAPWVIEEQLILKESLPLNLDMNSRHDFRKTLSDIRCSAKKLARDLPVVT